MKSMVLAVLAAFAVVSSPAVVAEESAQTKDMTTQESPAYLIIRFDADETRLPEFLDIMTNINELMASEEGFLSASVYRDADDSLSFTLIEAWATRALHREHFDRIVENGDWENILGMLTAEPEMSYNDML